MGVDVGEEAATLVIKAKMRCTKCTVAIIFHSFLYECSLDPCVWIPVFGS